MITRELPQDNTKLFSYKDDTTGRYIIPKPPVVGTDYYPPMSLHLPHNNAGLPVSNALGFTEMLIEKVKSLHSYSVPCIVSLPIQKGNKPFLDWILNETK